MRGGKSTPNMYLSLHMDTCVWTQQMPASLHCSNAARLKKHVSGRRTEHIDATTEGARRAVRALITRVRTDMGDEGVERLIYNQLLTEVTKAALCLDTDDKVGGAERRNLDGRQRGHEIVRCMDKGNTRVISQEEWGPQTSRED